MLPYHDSYALLDSAEGSISEEKIMKWYGITGSWRTIDSQVVADVRASVREIIRNGDGIVTGGALNVDWYATDEALRHDPNASHIKVCLPVKLDRYADHYFQRANEGVITIDQARGLVEQLSHLKSINPAALIEEEASLKVDKESYYKRNSRVVELSDVIVAFQVNNSEGVQDTIDKARLHGKKVILNRYSI